MRIIILKSWIQFIHSNSSFIFSLLLVLVSLCFYGAAGHDDSHITFSAVEQLNTTGSILNTNGQRVEQGSSFLHILGLSAFSKIVQQLPFFRSLALPDIGLIFSLLMAALCLPLIKRLAEHLDLKNTSLLFTALILSVSFTYWASGGLETSLVSLSILIFVYSHFKLLSPSIINKYQGTLDSSTIILYSLAATALILVRPENIAVSICYLLAVFTAITCALYQHIHTIAKPYKQITLLAFISFAPLILSFVLISLWRLNTFELIFPQPVAAKASGLYLQHILFGLGYFAYSAQPSLILFSIGSCIAALLLIVKPKPINQQQLLLICCLSFIVSYLAFIVFSGGDWMLGGRFFAHILPLLLLVSVYFINKIKKVSLCQGLLLILLVSESLFFSYSLSTGIPAANSTLINNKVNGSLQYTRSESYAWSERHNSVHLLDILFVDALHPIISSLINKPAIRSNKKIHIASVQMGMTPYHLNKLFPQQLYFIDMRGLSSQELSHCAQFDDAPRRQTGVYIRHDQYITAALNHQCQLPLPDIIYDLDSHGKIFNSHSMQKLKNLGYTIIWQQSGGISHGLQLGKVSAESYIAVSKAVHDALPVELQARQQRFSFVY